MLKNPRAPLALGAVFFALLVSGCGGGVPEGDVVSVDGVTTSEATFDRWIKIAGNSAAQGGQGAVPIPPDYTKCIANLKASAPKPVKGQPKPTDKQYKAQCEAQYNQLKDQVMTFLIRAQWLESEADKLGIKISDADVQKSFDQARKQAFPKTADFEKFLKESGQTQADLLFRQRSQVLEQKITEKINEGSTKVSDDEIKEYYEKNKFKQFGQPEKRDVRVVLTRDKAQAEAAKKALESGQSWDKVVEKYSIDPTSRDAGGVLRDVQESNGEKAFTGPVFDAKTGELTGPVKTTDGYYIFEVDKVTKPSAQPLSPALKASIKQIIVSENQREALTKFGKEYQDRWKSKTECAKGFVVPDCNNAKDKPASTVPPGAVPQQQTQTQQQQTQTQPAG
ncbi:MAG: peptidyl-prolyl cis-trans isomerase [Solirubrobacteraceae bacterium]|nr:peptidyl-prolyl cis-trans isomerase [Solirubrobacteraceae bacterium]